MKTDKVKKVRDFFNRKNILKQLKRMVSYLIPHRSDVNLELNVGGGSFTDGEKIVVGLPSMFIEMSEAEQFIALRALVGHESQHINSSDFEIFKKFIEDIGNYLYDNFKIPKGYGRKIAKHVFNSVEDGRIEKILCNKFNGYHKHLKFLNGTIWKHQELKGESEFQEFLYTITTISVTGLKPKGYDAIYKGTRLDDNVIKITPLIIDGINAEKCSDCASTCKDIIVEVEDYLKELLKDMSKETKETLDEMNEDSEYTTSEEKDYNSSESTKSTHFKPENKNKKQDDKKDKKDDKENQDGSGSGEDSEDDKKDKKSKGSKSKNNKKDKEEDKENSEENEGSGSGEKDNEDEENDKSNGGGSGDNSEEDEGKEENDESNSEDGEGKSKEDDKDSSEKDDPDDEKNDSKDNGESEDKDNKDDSSKEGENESNKDNSSDDSKDGDKSEDGDNQDSKDKEEDNEKKSSSKDDFDDQNPGGNDPSEERDDKSDEEYVDEDLDEITGEIINDAEEKIKQDVKSKKEKDKEKQDAEDTSLTEEEMAEIEEKYKNERERSFKEIKGYPNVVALPADIKKEGTKFRNEIEKILINKRALDRKNTKRGALDTGNLWKLGVKDYNVFQKKAHPHKSDYVAFLLQDGSGSMSSENKQYYSARALSVLEEGLKGIIPFKISTFSVGRGSVIHYTAKEFKDNEVKRNYAYNFFKQKTASGGNKDGYSIRVATKELLKRPEKDRILVILSDGIPTDYNGGTKAGLLDVKKAVKEARDAGIMVIAIMFGNEAFRGSTLESYKFMYEQNIIACDPENISKNVLKTFKKIIKR